MRTPSESGRLVVLGIDPGSITTGFGVIAQIGTRLVHIQSGSIHTPAKAPLQNRLKTIYDGLVQVIETNRPSVVALESIFFAKNVRAALTLAHARGVAILAAAQTGIDVAEYSPMEVKRATVGYGKASKDQIVTMMRHLLRLPADQVKELHDTTDALAVAVCHLNVAHTSRRATVDERAWRRA